MQKMVAASVAAAVALAGLPAGAFQEFDTSNSEVRPLIEAFSLDRGNLARTYNVDASPARAQRMKQFYTEWQGRLAKLNFDGMSQDGKVDYLLLRNFLNRESKRMDLDAAEDSKIASWVPFSQTIVGLEEARRRMQAVDAKKSAEILTGLPRQINDARRTVEALPQTPDRRVLATRAANDVQGLRGTLRGWFTFYNGYDPIFSWWNEEAYRTADTALEGYITFLRERVAGLRPAGGGEAAAAAPQGGRGGGRGGAGGGGRGGSATANARAGDASDIVGNPIGREGLMTELAFEMIPYTPEELIEIANKEFAWCENEMKKASREMGFGDDWKKALEKVKNMHVDPGKQPEMIRDLALEAIKFMDDHDLVTIPALARETWRMEMMPPERQLVNPFFTGGEVISVSFPTNAMTFEQKMMGMRGNNIPMSRATVFHELIPGHHLQGFVGARYKPYRSIIGGTPFITEGWALYWELLLWDMKFQKTPEDRVGALFWRMHRCARIIFSLSFHLGKMSPDECIALLVDRVGHERENAVGEVRRSFGGAYGPLYQAAYLLGGMQLYSLHKELVDGGKMTNRQFHDGVLHENRIPVEMIRASLGKQKLTREYTSNWRFYRQ